MNFCCSCGWYCPILDTLLDKVQSSKHNFLYLVCFCYKNTHPLLETKCNETHWIVCINGVNAQLKGGVWIVEKWIDKAIFVDSNIKLLFIVPHRIKAHQSSPQQFWITFHSSCLFHLSYPLQSWIKQSFTYDLYGKASTKTLLPWNYVEIFLQLVVDLLLIHHKEI